MHTNKTLEHIKKCNQNLVDIDRNIRLLLSHTNSKLNTLDVDKRINHIYLETLQLQNDLHTLDH